MTPPTQHLRPNVVDEPWDNLAREFVTKAIDDMERRKVVLKRYSKSELRSKVRRWLHYRYVIKKPLPRDLIDSIIQERLETAA